MKKKSTVKKPKYDEKEKKQLLKTFAKMEKRYKDNPCPSCRKTYKDVIRLKKEMFG